MPALTADMPPGAPTSVTPATLTDARPFAPLATDERIAALDVVRGFALFGIFLMNIEFFNRPFATINEGMPRGLTGADRLASWFIAYFVQGKFWTIFSMLFGMGFAVMLVRAERAGRADRAFRKIYLRRIGALAVFGAVHYIYLWHGDILFSYAVGALALLIVLYGRTWPIIIGCAVLFGLGALPHADGFMHAGGGLAIIGLLALYLRSEKHVAWRGVSLPLFSCLLMLAGALMAIAAVVLWALPDGPLEPRVPVSVLGPVLLATGWLSWRYHAPAERRSVRMAVAIYVFGGIVGTGIGLGDYLAPDPEAGARPATASVDAGVVAGEPGLSSASTTSTSAKAHADRATKHREEREKQLAEHAADKVEEVEISTHGSYLDGVALRGSQFVEKASNDTGFAVVLVAMFLLGAWFVRSGVMERPVDHLPFFRKLALYGLPAGIGLGLVGSLIATSHVPGERYDGWGIATGMRQLGNLPACLGYVGLVVTMTYSRHRWLSAIRVLAPAGRMALTNYLVQSLICTIWFYGFGFGHWGLPRAQQVLFVVVVFAVQVAFSHWWLARFRYGPMEWLWRGFTYRQVPAMRGAGSAPVASSRAV